MDHKAEDSTNYSSDPNYENLTTNEGEDSNLDKFKVTDDTPAQQQPM